MWVEAAGLVDVPLGCVDLAALCRYAGCDDPQRPVASRTVNRLVEPTGSRRVAALGLRDKTELDVGTCGPRLDCLGCESLRPRLRRISGGVSRIAVAEVDAGGKCDELGDD